MVRGEEQMELLAERMKVLNTRSSAEMGLQTIFWDIRTDT